MAVAAKLLEALERKLGLGRRQVDRRIAEEAAQKHLTRELAAISLAASVWLPIHRFATAADLAQLRGAAPMSHPTSVDIAPKPSPLPRRVKKVKATKDNSMFVVHGRDEKLNRDMYAFLSSIGIVPMEWDHAIKAAKGGANPIVGDVIRNAMEKVQGVMVLLSPDEEARLKARLASANDKKKGRHLSRAQM